MFASATSTDERMVELLRAIRNHSELELSSIRDAGTYGADSGFAGFTFTVDGAEFFRANRETIWMLLSDDAEQFDMNVAQFVGSFQRADMTDDADSFECLLAWYALEAVGRWLNDRRDNR